MERSHSMIPTPSQRHGGISAATYEYLMTQTADKHKSGSEDDKSDVSEADTEELSQGEADSGPKAATLVVEAVADAVELTQVLCNASAQLTAASQVCATQCCNVA